MDNRKKMKIGAVVLTGGSLILAFVTYRLNQTAETPGAGTRELEQNVKDLSNSLANAKVKEIKRDKQLEETIDKEVSRTVDNPQAAKELKVNLKTSAAETSAMPALEDATTKTKNLETNVEDLKNRTATPSDTTWLGYNPKLLFSVILLAASLWVILRGTYSETTEKWAFAMISLIAGVWIGTATS